MSQWATSLQEEEAEESFLFITIINQRDGPLFGLGSGQLIWCAELHLVCRIALVLFTIFLRKLSPLLRAGSLAARGTRRWASRQRKRSFVVALWPSSEWVCLGQNRADTPPER